MPIKKSNLISEESVIANTMNQYFTSLTKQLNLKKSPQLKNFKDIINYYRSSRPEVFCKTGVLKYFTKHKRKHLCQSLFFNKVADFRDSGTGVFL